MIDKRLMDISDLLANYSTGNFDYEIQFSDKLDEIDTIISSINMLGEELKETTISRDFFSSIYDAVSNMLFVLDNQGTIIDINQSVSRTTGLENLIGTQFIDLSNSEKSDLDCLQIKDNAIHHTFETEFRNTFSKTLYVTCEITRITKRNETGYLVVAEDITEKKESEKRILKAILETQENERKRVADDLHDSLGQELSSLKMMLGLSKRNTTDPEQNKLLQSSIDILENSIKGVRNVCFDLMPSILAAEGLIYALHQLIENTPFHFEFTTNIDKLNLDVQQEVSIYRVIQEFVNNSMKHSKGDEIAIDILKTDKQLDITISDNGKGFENVLDLDNQGRGLNTMKSRIEAFGGSYKLTSELNKGVTLNISFL